MKKYTIEEIKNYILSQDSLGDVLYNLSEENIDKANEDKKSNSDILDEYEWKNSQSRTNLWDKEQY